MKVICNPEDQSEVPQLKTIDGGIDTSQPLQPYVAKHNCRYDCSFLDHSLLQNQTAEAIAYTIALRMARLTLSKHNKIHPIFIYYSKFFAWCQSALKIDPPSASKIDPPQAVVFTSLPSF
jgi:hypothetical protein